MAISFPTPNMGDPSTLTTTQAGITWTWNNTLGVWSTEATAGTGGGANVSVGENPPASPEEGDLWWANSDVDEGGGRLYIYKAGAWVDTSLPGGGGDDGDPGVGADAWSRTTSAGIPTSSYNIASCTETSTGVYEYTFEVPMPSDVYATVATSRSNNARMCHTGSESTTGFIVRISDQSNTLVSAAHSVVVHATNATLPEPLQQDDLLFVDGRNASEATQEFQAGVSVTGGEGVQVTETTTHWNRINSYPTFNRAESDEIHGIVSGLAGNTNNNDFNAFFVPTSVGDNKGDSSVTVTGFKSAISFGTNQYNFYAAGTADNYFAGIVRTGTHFNKILSDNTITDGQSWNGYVANKTTDPVTKTAGVVKGFSASNLTNGTEVRGFSSEILAGSGRYNFYASGEAPNYFAGDVFIGVDSNLTNVAESPRLALVGSSEPRIYSTIGSEQGASIFSVTKEYSEANPGAAYFYKFQKGNGTSPATVVGSIYTDGATTTFQQSTSDYRIKTNIQPITSAANAVKLLNPVNYEFIDRNVGTVYQGFIAHELAEICPKAVVGTKDATESIGTLIDWDGTELETDVVEPDELTYTEEVETDGVATMVTRTRTWSATGTRPVYQGVDQTKLIPLLTKALQEALDKIETLETRLSDAGIA